MEFSDSGLIAAFQQMQAALDAVLRMLNFNDAQSKRRDTETSAPYKLLILDDFSMAIIAPLIGVKDLRQKGGVTLHLNITSKREPIPDVPAVYFVQPTQANIELILKDAESMLYDSLHLNFTSHVPKALLEQLAEGAVKRSCAHQIAKVFDQYLAYISLEPNMFSLGLPNTYLELNNPAARDYEIEASTSSVVEGLFSALASMACVPIIRCPKGGAAEHIAGQLEGRIRVALRGRNSLFHGAASPGLASSMNRPLLCLFDRNFELSVIVQHSWTYKPLVHDVLRMELNRVTLDSQSSNGLGQGSHKKSFEVGEGDPFWERHGRAIFPEVAKEVHAQTTQYKEEINKFNLQQGTQLDPNQMTDELLNTQGLMDVVTQLPQLTEKRRNLDKHTEISHALMKEIKLRGLDHLYNEEEGMLQGNGDLSAVENVFQRPQKHDLDCLRLALVYLLTTSTLPTDQEFARLESAIGNQDPSHLAALRYVRRMRRLNLTGKVTQQAVAAEFAGVGGMANNQLSSWVGNTFGQGVNALTRGVKKLLPGEQQAAVTVAVEGLMDAKSVPELDSFAFFDPKAPQGRMTPTPGMTYKEAIVFIVGGGNYLEAESLTTWASKATPVKKITYGATELLNGEAFARQLAELGRMSS